MFLAEVECDENRPRFPTGECCAASVPNVIMFCPETELPHLLQLCSACSLSAC
jgi:hypothetical protein